MRVLAALYVALLLGIVALADLGVLGGLLTWIHHIPAADKLCHFLFALVLGCLVEAAHGGSGHALRWVLPIVLLEELSQLFVPGRSFDLGDLAADAVGILAGTALAIRARRTLPVRPLA